MRPTQDRSGTLSTRFPASDCHWARASSGTLEGFALQWKRQPSRTADPLGEDGWSLPSRLTLMIVEAMTEARG